MELSDIEFPIAQARELYDLLKLKQQEYFVRIKGSTRSWDPSWYEKDLIIRHDTDPSFRLRYYKFVIVSILIMACDKHKAMITRGDTDIEDSVNSRLIGIDLSHALYRQIDVTDFNEACSVVMDYLSGVISLDSSNQIPTTPKSTPPA